MSPSVTELHFRISTSVTEIDFPISTSTIGLHLSFIYPERGGFGEIFPEVMIFPEGFSPRKKSSLKEIFRRIPRVEAL